MDLLLGLRHDTGSQGGLGWLAGVSSAGSLEHWARVFMGVPKDQVTGSRVPSSLPHTLNHSAMCNMERPAEIGIFSLNIIECLSACTPHGIEGKESFVNL